MINLYIYSIIFSVLFIGSTTTFVVLYKKYKTSIKTFKQKIILYSISSTLIISLFAAIYCISQFIVKDDEISSISRPNIGEGDSTISINVNSEIYSGTIDIEVQEKQITFEEAINIFSKYRDELDHFVLSENKSFSEITSPLNFPSQIGTENISISWYISDPNIIDYTGDILFDNMLSDNANLEITATLKLGGHFANILYNVTVTKKVPTAKEQLSKYLNNHINDSSLLNKKNINLPTDMNGMELDFYKKKSSYPPYFFLLLIIAIPILIIILEKKNQRDEIQKKNLELIADYPEFVAKLSLLILTGLSIFNALNKIINDYHSDLTNGKKRRHLYDELTITCQKIQNGMYESYAYEEFGRRTGLSCYIKFSSLLISGLNRGNSNFNHHLSQEATSSLLDHKAFILQQGSKASTKLIVPMMLIFATILVIVIIPAFFSINL